MRQLWAGFVDGRVFLMEIDTGFGGFGAGKDRMQALFTSRRAARAQFKDVRRVEIREIKP